MILNRIKEIKMDRGFTIVELLIVIVIIAILAAITLLAYNGVQSRARAAQYQTDAMLLDKKTESYAASSTAGTYPLVAAGSDLPSVVTQTTAGTSLTTLMNGLSESKLPATMTIFAVVASAPTYAQTMNAINASTTSDSYFVQYCTTGKGMYIYYPDPVASTAKSTTVGVCP